MTENAFAFAASAMIPIGQASTAGNLTFKSTETIVAKEGISMGAGAGAQKITTDVTGNDTAGMVAGMVASGMTAKGLNGIEAEANKLAKAPKGIDGVTEGAGNLAEDVGKAGKGLEGAAKGAESAAEDAGKVVESGRISNLDDGLNFSNRALEHMGESGRQVPIQTLQDAIRYGEAMPDPRGSNTTMYYTTMYKNGKMYNLEVLYDEISNTVYHFEYARKAMGNLPAIPK